MFSLRRWERRRAKWLEQLAEAVNEVQKKVAELTPEKLSANDVFISTALHAAEIASRTHQDEKLKALRNTVVNSASRALGFFWTPNCDENE